MKQFATHQTLRKPTIPDDARQFTGSTASPQRRILTQLFSDITATAAAAAAVNVITLSDCCATVYRCIAVDEPRQHAAELTSVGLALEIARKNAQHTNEASAQATARPASRFDNADRYVSFLLHLCLKTAFVTGPASGPVSQVKPPPLAPPPRQSKARTQTFVVDRTGESHYLMCWSSLCCDWQTNAPEFVEQPPNQRLALEVPVTALTSGIAADNSGAETARAPKAPKPPPPPRLPDGIPEDKPPPPALPVSGNLTCVLENKKGTNLVVEEAATNGDAGK